MIDALYTPSPWARAVVAIAADVALKATVLYLAALLCDRLLVRRRALVRSGMWHACLLGLVALPLVAAAFPRLRIRCLPPTETPTAPEAMLTSTASGDVAPFAPSGPSFHDAAATPDPGKTGQERTPAEGASNTFTAERRSLTPFELAVREQRAMERTKEVARRHRTLMARAERHGDMETVPMAEPLPEIAPSAASSEAARSEAPRRIDWAALVSIVYLAGATLLAVRLIGSLWAVRRLRRSASPLDDADWTRALRKWRQRLGIRRPVFLAWSDRIRVPATVGWRRPVILLPASLAEPGADGHRDAILLHELAHVRRRDYAWQLLLRATQAIYWPHPLMWVMARMTAAAREQTCDDLCVGCLTSRQSYRTTLIEVAAGLAHRRWARPAYVATPMARSSRLTRRLRRIDVSRGAARCLPARRVRAAIAILGLAAIGLIGPIELAHRTAEAKPPEAPTTAPAGDQVKSDKTTATKPSAPSANPTTTRTATSAPSETAAKRTIRFNVVHAETGKPLSDVLLNLSIDRKRSIGRTGAEGRYTIKLPKKEPWEVIVWANRPRFVPMQVYFRGFSQRFELPSTYTLKLSPGTEIGGRVLEPDGKPVRGATVHVSMPFEEAMERVYVSDVPVPTDAEGRWVCGVMPENIEGVRLHVTHPAHIGDRNSYSRPTPPLAKLRDKSYVMEMKPGLSVSGRVVDKDDKPVDGAHVILGREGFVDGLPKTRTDKQGRFRFDSAEPGTNRVTVYAPGYAPVQQNVEVGAGLKPLSFRLMPPQTIHGRVVDPDGNPLAGVSTTPMEWRGLHFHEFKIKTDKDGRFRWDNAPADTVGFYIGKTGYETLHNKLLRPTKEGHTITLAPTLVVDGKVADAATGKPIKQFSVKRGTVGTDGKVTWESGGKTFGSGRYTTGFNRAAAAYQVRIDADGYRPVHSRTFKPSTKRQVCHFKLEPDEGITGIVQRPDGKPLAGARLVLIKPTAFAMIRDGQSPRHTGISRRSDDDGRFRFPAQEGSFGIIVAHELGYAEVTSEEFAAARTITLAPWGRIEGTLRLAGKLAPHKVMSLSWDVPRKERKLSVSHFADARTDKGGRFVFPRVAPGQVRIRYDYADSRDPVGSNFDVGVRVKSGETAKVHVGGTTNAPMGRTVTGRIVPPAGSHRKIDWSKDQRAWMHRSEVHNVGSALGMALKLMLQRKSDPSALLDEEDPNRPDSYNFGIGPDGSFRIVDVLPGHYWMRVALEETNRNPLENDTEQIGQLEHEFTVPASPPGQQGKPFDLGALTFKFRRILEVGQPAPPFDVPVSMGDLSDHVADGRRLRLTDFTGKGQYVLLAFWGNAYASKRWLEHIKAVRDAFGDDDRLVMVFIVESDHHVDGLPEVIGKDNPRARLTVLPYDAKQILEDYGMPDLGRDSPCILLIGPDGMLLANKLKGPGIKKAVADALGVPHDHPPAATQKGKPEAAGPARALAFEVIRRDTKKPVPEVSLTLVGRRTLTARTDKDGQYRVQLGEKGALSLFITAEKPGFVPIVVKWSNGGPAPEDGVSRYTLAMEPATAIGGVVQDDAGKPLADVRVTLNLRRKDPQAGPDATIKIWNLILESDAKGRWRYDGAPADLEGLSITLTHPGCVETVLAGSTLPPSEKLCDMTTTVALEKAGRGIAVTGSVQGPTGRPVEGASVSLSPALGTVSVAEILRTHLDRTPPKTDAEGRFCVYSRKPGSAVVLVEAPAYAPSAKEIDVRENMDPVTLRMAPGHTLRGRVVDAQGKPLSDVSVLADILGHRFGGSTVHLNTNEQGQFVWKNAPDRNVAFTFMDTDRKILQTSLAPGDDEHVITLYRPTHIKGTVVDAKTDKPIEAFHISPVADTPKAKALGMTWKMMNAVTIRPGRFEIKTEVPMPMTSFRFRIEAEGYDPFVSREFTEKDEDVTLETKLKTSKWSTGTVRAPDGTPLDNAVIVLAENADIVGVENRQVKTTLTDYLIARSNDSGEFSLPRRPEPSGIVVLHEKGYALIPAERLAADANVTIRPWGRVEGSLHIGATPVANRKVTVMSITSEDNLPMVSHDVNTKTDDRGRFLLERVFPGIAVVSYQVHPDRGKAGAARQLRLIGQPDCLMAFEVASGQTVRLQLGGTGRPVIGRIQLPPALAGEKKITWNHSQNLVVSRQPPPPVPTDVKAAGWQRQQAWLRAWRRTDAGKAYLAVSRQYPIVVQPDGTFRADDVPPGEYALALSVSKPPASRFAILPAGEQELGHVRHEFTVPPMNGDRSDEPLDLGTLVLHAPKKLAVGDPAPPFDVATTDGRLRLADLRGKIVLLHVGWAIPLPSDPLEKVHKAFGEDPRFAMVSVHLSLTPWQPYAEVLAASMESAAMDWPTGWLNWADSEALRDAYGLSRHEMPWDPSGLFLIGPDGKILATGLAKETIESTVSKILADQPATRGADGAHR